jgi:nucleotide-binding universal stress UspA family protein
MAEAGRYRRILVPLDGSGWSQRALPHAIDIARSNGSEIVLLHVFSPPAQVYAPELAVAGQDTVVGELRDSMTRYLQGVCAEVRETGVNVHTQMIDNPDVPAAICQFVRNDDIDLVVMSTHGRTGLARLFFGSVAKAVMEHTKVPILLVHPDKETETA